MDSFIISRATNTKYFIDTITALLDKGFHADFVRYGYKPPSYHRAEEKTIQCIDFGHTYIGYLGEEPVSTISVMPTDREGVYEVKALVTLPDFQGKGIGKMMMDFAHNNTVDAKVFTLTTPVDKKDNFKFYTDFGYEVVGEFLEHGNPIYIFEKPVKYK